MVLGFLSRFIRGKVSHAAGCSGWSLEFAEEVYRGFEGKATDFSGFRFRKLGGALGRVVEALRLIPRGKVATYGGLARFLGTHARAVASCLSWNPYPIVYPCHRVVSSDLSVGGYAFGRRLKMRILLKEGVRFHGEKVSEESVLELI
ncbi:MAG: hypothetical protein DRN96_04905 [Thermoproteota archaeon]|nr:MAG: hypothetical protein DRN96_04905 [Candidatus Korarchaeota archaeon]